MNAPRCTRLYAEVNFLPDWYTRKQRLRLSKKRQAALLMLMVAGMAVLTVQTWRERAELRSERNRVRDLLSEANNVILEVQKLTTQRGQLEREVEIHRELYQPINYSQVTGTLAALTPESITFRALEVQTQQVTSTRKMTAAELEAAKKAQANRRGAVKDTVASTRSMIVIDLVGLAPSDVELANFIGQLASSKVFENVKMVFSKQGELEGRLTREFKIRMEIPLDRRYVDRAAQEVADAN